MSSRERMKERSKQHHKLIGNVALLYPLKYTKVSGVILPLATATGDSNERRGEEKKWESKKKPNVNRDHTFFLLLFSCITHFGLAWLGEMCWRPTKNKKQIERGAAKLLWWHFHFFFFFSLLLSFSSSPLSFTCVSIIIHKKSDDLAFRVWQIATRTHNPQPCTHTGYVLYRWVNGILNGRPIGVFLTLKNIFESSSFHCRCCYCSCFQLVSWFMRHR